VRYAGTERDDDGPWFTLGQLQVSTPVLVLLVWAATLVVWVIEGPGRTISQYLWLDTAAVQSGEVWRLVTWPFVHGSFQLWDIINAAIFWMFGTELERQTGRRAFGVLTGSSIIVIGIAAVVFGAILGSPTILADLDLLALTVVLLYCAEHPTRPFFFNIPAWVIAAVIAALEIVNDLAERDTTRLFTVLVASAVIALIAKKVGLLSAYDRVPELSLPGRGGSDRPAPAKAPKPGKGGGLGGRFRRGEAAEIVAMPTQPMRPRPTPVVPDDVSADDLALDALLDKISATGIDSLTEAERRQLDEIRERRRHD
jgi:membrane associated rhomboid family serine protease